MKITKGLTALVGGGGKTTLMYRLGYNLSNNSKVIITTSTKIRYPDCTTIIDPSERDILSALKDNNLIAIGNLTNDSKLTQTKLRWELLCELADYVIVEADGSKCKPLKAPEAHEPAIPRCAKLVIALCGMDCIYNPISICAHRPELYARLCNKNIEDYATPFDVAHVLSSPSGQYKNVASDYMIILNKVDSPDKYNFAIEVQKHLKYPSILSILNDKSITILDEHNILQTI